MKGLFKQALLQTLLNQIRHGQKNKKQNETFLHSTFIFCVISDNYDSNQAQAFILQASFNF